jgi:ATP-dependent DNA helicase RecQ
VPTSNTRSSEPSASGVVDGALARAIRETFGFESLRPLQREAMAAALDGRHALVVMPTGGGKSLCYQAPALVRDGFTLVVSPLIALMADQVRGLEEVGIPAAALHSGHDPIVSAAIFEQLSGRELKVLYCSPERLVAPGFFAHLRSLGMSAIAVDEAHCISHWGHDFRPEYRQLGGLFAGAPDVPVMALTATATPRVQDDVVAQLGLRDPVRLVGDFDRPNLTYRIRPRTDLVRQVHQVAERHAGQAGIVYVIRRTDTESLAASLVKLGVRADAYHAGMSSDARTKVQDAFLSERLDVVVATVAFGMGIDRSDVRFVVHAALPKGVEQYSQETGRAGRDGLPAECLMLYSGSDYHGWRNLMERSAGEAEEAGMEGARAELEANLARLSELWRFAGGANCRHRFLVEHFGGTFEAQPEGCGACDVCLGELEHVADSGVLAQKILSCVVHCRPGRGAAHIADVLAGKRTAKLVDLGHDQFTTFGLCSEYSTAELRSFLDQLVGQGHIAVASGRYPTLSLTRDGLLAMRGEVDVKLVRPVLPKPAKRAARTGRPAPIVDDPELDSELVEKLRSLRREMAREKGLPPYVLFNDRTLVALVQRRPKTIEELLTVEGIGQKKADTLGEVLLEALAPS